MNFNIDDTFNKQLPLDTSRDNTSRLVTNACASIVLPHIPSQPELLHTSLDVAEMVGLNERDLATPNFLDVFSGKKILPQTQPYAMCYGGHQFGQWAGQLGDGRAINLFEVLSLNKQRLALQLKGAGPTPYSRSADGFAVLRSSLREHLCSHAMHHLGVPTTHSLCLIKTGEQVIRDVLYNGNPRPEAGAIICRVAPSFVRFGHFEIFAARKDLKTLRELTNYTIKYFFPEITGQDQTAYLQFFKAVSERTRLLILHWLRVGFVHGVMNTDNMSILGLTIDYGPYGWLEGFDPNWTPNTTDYRQHRYSYGKQAHVGLWNVCQLANALNLLIEDTSQLQSLLDEYQKQLDTDYLNVFKIKLGLYTNQNTDSQLVEKLFELFTKSETDMTLFFRKLSLTSKNQNKFSTIEDLDFILDCFYKRQEIKGDLLRLWLQWFKEYTLRLQNESLTDQERQEKMNTINPKYVLRNYMAQMCIDQLEAGDSTLLLELFEMLKKPYSEQPQYENWFKLRPDWARDKVGCSALSCSS